ncbi:TIGR04222 domain-containing membrane protein [bacterium]|nr:MAG: TIGR04222 domain-containing membrane protein [bacterium]
MNQSHSELWSKLEALDLDGNAQLPFSLRLARDNGWAPEFARRVVDEYKKFVFLAATAGHPVSPPEEVDQAWHLHLMYTHSYWDELCGEILGFALHHGPTRGGASESAKFGNWYAKTLESYEKAFEEAPPSEIWPDASTRFSEAGQYRRVDIKRAWVVRKPQWAVQWGKRPKMRMPTHAMLLGRLAPMSLLLLIAGCAAPTNLNVSQWNGAEFLGAYWTLCAVALAFVVFLKTRDQPPVDAVFPMNPLDAYEIARLKENGDLPVDVALASLYVQGAIVVTPDGLVSSTGTVQPSNPFERDVLNRIGDQNTVLSVRNWAKLGMMSSLAAIDRKLYEAGLLLSPAARRSANMAPLGVMFALLGIGGIRIFTGIMRQKPTGFLFLTCCVLLALTIWVATSTPRRSKRGDLLLKRMNSIPAPSNLTNFQPGQMLYGADIGAAALFFAVAGPGMFPDEIHRATLPPSHSSGGDGGGSGCSSSSGDSGGGGDSGGDSGGGCGGGCGGCGGGGD